MAYTYQSFTSAAVFTSAQAQQIEDNIRDHQHGAAGVGPSGASWVTTSQATAFNLASTDAGKLYKCYGDFEVTCAAAATLGTGFGAAFVNVGSGRIAINAAAGQWVAGNSCYAITPGEGIVLTSDGAELEVVGGRDRAMLGRVVQTVTSAASVEFLKLFPNDFTFYHLYVQPNTGTAGLVQFQVSVDSGSSYFATGYANSIGAQTNCINLTHFNTTSRDCLYSEAKFCNADAVRSANMHFMVRGVRRSAGIDDGWGYITSAGVINALKIIKSAGYFMDGTRVEVWAEGRIRR